MIVPTKNNNSNNSCSIIFDGAIFRNWFVNSTSVAAINAIYKTLDQIETYRDLLIKYKPVVTKSEVPKSGHIILLVISAIFDIFKIISILNTSVVIIG